MTAFGMKPELSVGEPPPPLIPAANKVIELLGLLRRQDLANCVARLLADSIELSIGLLLGASEFAHRAVKNLSQLRDLRIGKVELALEAVHEALSMEGTVPAAGVPGVEIGAGSPDDHPQKKRQGKIEVSSSAHCFL